MTAPATSSSTPSAPTEDTEASSDAGSTASEEAATTCLFTVDQVSHILSGDWTRHVETGQPCSYTSDRGAQIVTNVVDQAVQPALRDARDACAKGVRPISTAKGGFVCVEQREDGDLVVGNIARQGRPWIVVIVPMSASPHEAELTAMTSLMNSAFR